MCSFHKVVFVLCLYAFIIHGCKCDIISAYSSSMDNHKFNRALLNGATLIDNFPKIQVGQRFLSDGIFSSAKKDSSFLDRYTEKYDIPKGLHNSRDSFYKYSVEICVHDLKNYEEDCEKLYEICSWIILSRQQDFYQSCTSQCSDDNPWKKGLFRLFQIDIDTLPQRVFIYSSINLNSGSLLLENILKNTKSIYQSYSQYFSDLFFDVLTAGIQRLSNAIEGRKFI